MKLELKDEDAKRLRLVLIYAKCEKDNWRDDTKKFIVKIIKMIDEQLPTMPRKIVDRHISLRNKV